MLIIYIYTEDKYYIVDTSNFNSIPDIIDFFDNNPTYDRYLFALYSSDENFDNKERYDQKRRNDSGNHRLRHQKHYGNADENNYLGNHG